MAAENVLRLLSWNIDGLDENNKTERTEEVCRVILLKRPHVVFLQEVVDDTKPILTEKLGRVYSLHVHPSPPAHYYPAILVQKNVDVLESEKLDSIEFPQSTMGRHLLILNVKFQHISFSLFTSHLESMKNYGAERKRQLKVCFSEMLKRTQEGKICLFGGDLNVRDKEVAEVCIPDGIADVWQACGGSESEKFTWDSTINDNLNLSFKVKLRLDRLYISPFLKKDTDPVRPVKFELVGQDRLAHCQRFPSDHWGMWAEFSIHNDKAKTV